MWKVNAQLVCASVQLQDVKNQSKGMLLGYMTL